MSRQSLIRVPVGSALPTEGFAWACGGAAAEDRFADLEGFSFGGSYSAAAEWMDLHAERAEAFVVMFSRGEGMEAFLASLPKRVLSVPMAGGAVARETGSTSGKTTPPAQDVAVFAICEGQWEARSLSWHFPVGEKFRCLGSDPRRVDQVEVAGEVKEARGFLAEVRRSLGLGSEDWDRLALLGEDGFVRHLHAQGTNIGCGADLPASRQVWLALFDEGRGAAEIADVVTPQSLVFGCAGLYELFTAGRSWEGRAASTYLYGELASVHSQPGFANLTFTVLQRLS